MINTIWHVCAVPLDLPGTRRETGQMCPYCRRDMMATLQAGNTDLALPDVVTSNTPSPTPLHDVYFFPTEELCPAHAHIRAPTHTHAPPQDSGAPTHTHAPTQDSHAPATPTAPSCPLDLPLLQWIAHPPRKEQDRGAPGEAEGACVEWAQVGKELKQVADTFQSEHRATAEEQQESFFVNTLATGLCLSLLCLISWKVLTQTQ